MNSNKPIYLLLLLLGTACSEKESLVTISTPYGDMHAILYDDTPKHKENFIKLTNEGFYDSLLFHRVMENFMIQGGDPDSRGAGAGAALGTGGPGYTIPAEFNKNHFHRKGALSAARLPDNQNPDKESSGSQFYIVQGQTFTRKQLTIDEQKLFTAAQQAMDLDDSLRQELTSIYENQGPPAYGQKVYEICDYIANVTGKPITKDIDPNRVKAYTTVGGAPHLDDEYTVFGMVIDGLDVLDTIAAQPTDSRDRPITDVPFSIAVEKVSKNRITNDYGYDFPEE